MFDFDEKIVFYIIYVKKYNINMGWQSYYVPYTSKDELKPILDAINEYQKIVFGETKTEEEVGEEICQLCFARVSKPRKIGDKYVVFFGIGGGRGYCNDFFMRRKININCFEFCKLSDFEKGDLWFRYDTGNNGFNYFTPEFVNELEALNYVNFYTQSERKSTLSFIKKNKTYWDNELKNAHDNELSEIVRQILKDFEEENAM
jgi:hypothetical protein